MLDFSLTHRTCLSNMNRSSGKAGPFIVTLVCSCIAINIHFLLCICTHRKKNFIRIMYSMFNVVFFNNVSPKLNFLTCGILPFCMATKGSKSILNSKQFCLKCIRITNWFKMTVDRKLVKRVCIVHVNCSKTTYHKSVRQANDEF